MVELRSPYLRGDDTLRAVAAGDRPLTEGETSPSVAQLQAALRDLGYGLTRSTGPGQIMDGAFGAETAALIKTFQRDSGLGQTGVLDAGTLTAVDQALANKLPLSPSNRGRRSRTTATPSATAVGRAAGPIGPSTPRPLFQEDDHYMLGTEDPFFIPDYGIGPWNSKPASYSARAKAFAIQNALIHKFGLVVGWHANQHLLHYFSNSGLDYQIDLENMVRTVPSARDLLVRAYRLAKAFLQDLPVGTYDFTMKYAQEGYNDQSESTDWYFAIGGYKSWGKGRAQVFGNGPFRQYRMDFTYRLSDRYNWDSGKSVNLGPLNIQDRVLGEFHLQGLAKEFTCLGSLRRSFQ